jgi:organic hydroperoxide reductase OsmC/OhrA
MKTHTYAVGVAWTGNGGAGTANYQSYRREFTIEAAGKAAILASSDPAFRGDASRHNPEELLVSALSGCHMLWYLHLCSTNGITVIEYHDNARGVMELAPDGAGQFVSVELRPKARVAIGTDLERARALHQEAHRFCFIGRSVNFPVQITPEIVTS